MYTPLHRFNIMSCDQGNIEADLREGHAFAAKDPRVLGRVSRRNVANVQHC